MSEIRLAGIVNDSITDGPGLRLAIFAQGCPHHCAGCHNPDSHDFHGGTLTDTTDLIEMIKNNPLLSGVTFTGGEPMCQAGVLADLAFTCKKLGLDVAVYTGYTFEEIITENDADRMRLLEIADVLIDGRFILEQRSLDLRFKGSANQRILNSRESLSYGVPVLEHSTRWN